MPTTMEPRECALLLTDLRGSTRMVGFLDQLEGAAILQTYAHEVSKIVEKNDGKVKQFTGDGVFAYFGLDERTSSAAASQRARDCALEIHGFTSKFFSEGEIRDALLASGGITIAGSRTALHWARVMYGQIAGATALVGPQVVALYRACDRDDLFSDNAIILSGPFLHKLHLPSPLQPIVSDLVLDASLPPMTFYPHPALAKRAGK